VPSNFNDGEPEIAYWSDMPPRVRRMVDRRMKAAGCHLTIEHRGRELSLCFIEEQMARAGAQLVQEVRVAMAAAHPELNIVC